MKTGMCAVLTMVIGGWAALAGAQDVHGPGGPAILQGVEATVLPDTSLNEVHGSFMPVLPVMPVKPAPVFVKPPAVHKPAPTNPWKDAWRTFRHPRNPMHWDLQQPHQRQQFDPRRVRSL